MHENNSEPNKTRFSRFSKEIMIGHTGDRLLYKIKKRTNHMSIALQVYSTPMYGPAMPVPDAVTITVNNILLESLW